MSQRKFIVDIVAFIFGCFLVGSGIYGWMKPWEMAEIFGIPKRTADMIVFYPGIGGRNLAAGLAVWAMTFTRQRKALGMFLTCWMLAGFADTHLLLAHTAEVENVWIHVMNTCILAVIGPSLLAL